MLDLIRNRPIFAWALYDWANSAFATTVMAGFFPVFFSLFWSTGVDSSATTARLGYANAVAGFALALLAPMLGAIGDRGGRRKAFLFGWTLLGVCATGAMYFIGKGEWGSAALCFVLASMGFNGGIVFNDSLLLDVARPEEYDRVSAFGYALGYLGGGLLLAVNLAMYAQPGWFGLRDGAHAVQASFMSVAVWWFVFTLPLMFRVREQHQGAALPFLEAARTGFRELAATLRRVREYRAIGLFLVAYWFYIDGVNTIIKMAVNYGMSLHLDAGKLLLALLITQLVGFPAALLFGWLGDRIGARRGILIGIAAYAAITFYAYFLDTAAEFFALAIAVGLVQGGVQSLSRSLFGRLVPEGKNAEFFGFYNMMGKFAAFLGPFLMGVTADLTHNTRASIVSLVLLFAIGGVLLWRVKLTPPAA